MKRNEIIFSILKIPLDFCVVFFSFFIARELRLVTDLIPWVQLPIQTISNENLTLLSFYWALLLIVLFASHKMYTIKITSSKIKESLDIIRYSLYWFFFFSVFVYLAQGTIYHGKEIPRLIIIYTLFWTIFGLFISRLFLGVIQNFLLKKWYISKKNLLIITNKSKKEIEPILDDIYETGIYSIVWYANPEEIKMKDIPYVGWFWETLKILQSRSCEEILFIDSDFGKDELLQIWEISRIFGIRYRYITNSFDVTRSNTSISLINHIPVIEINTTPLDNWGRVTKRIIDILGALWGLIVFSPLMILTALLIKIEEPNAPVIYKNKRVGQWWKSFFLYKFRYIQWKYCIKDSYWVKEEDDEALKYEKELIEKRSSRSGPLYKIESDPRKSKVGKFIEKYSIDELPQFFNVLLWNMSLVWPRPHQPREVKKYDLHHRMLLTVKPWITWMAQVHGREKNEFEEEARLDIFYIENWNFLLDLKIVLKTFVTILMRR
jgi:lipopolysaccharide/colanic/teichoic acid biosynthesis glycosyltransferase